jgi:hypothetical protein
MIEFYNHHGSFLVFWLLIFNFYGFQFNNQCYKHDISTRAIDAPCLHLATLSETRFSIMQVKVVSKWEPIATPATSQEHFKHQQNLCVFFGNDVYNNLLLSFG